MTCLQPAVMPHPRLNDNWRDMPTGELKDTAVNLRRFLSQHNINPDSPPDCMHPQQASDLSELYLVEQELESREPDTEVTSSDTKGSALLPLAIGVAAFMLLT